MTGPVPQWLEERLTSEPLVAHLATCTDGRPHVAPVWYRYDDGSLEVVVSGKKLANVRANPHVAVSIEKGGGDPEWMATILGTATVVEDDDAFREANRRLNAKYGASADAYPQNTLVRIDVGSATSRRY